MEENVKWYFPDNGYGLVTGLDESGIETFKKDPLSSFAREVCQNSIDAALGEKPVKIVFSVFKVSRSKIPGINELSSQIERVYEFNKEDPKDGMASKLLFESITEPTITCLRVSDFNTTGAAGVDSNDMHSPFYSLTRGSGISKKGNFAGGSKGIGKYASFVVSGTNTVFYSTLTCDGKYGYMGISRLCSVPIDKNNPNLMTQGTGYWAKGEEMLPIEESVTLDPSFTREEDDSGTDLYLVGFNDEENWKIEILMKVLDSFMVAILL